MLSAQLAQSMPSTFQLTCSILFISLATDLLFDKYKVTLDKRIASEKKIEDDYQALLAKIKKQQEDFPFPIERKEHAMKKNSTE